MQNIQIFYASPVMFVTCFWVDLADILPANTNSGKLNFNLRYWSDMLKNGWNLLDHRTLKSGVSQKWFDGSSRLMGSFLHADSE